MGQETIKTILRYDGEALKGNSIDIDVFGESLVSLSQLVREANRVVYGDKHKIKITVNANIEQNCFEILLEFASIIVEQTSSFLASEEAKEIKNILEWIGIIWDYAARIATTAGGVYYLCKKYEGKKISPDRIKKQDGGKTAICDESGDIIDTVDDNVYKIYNSIEAKRYAQGFIKPLQREGIDEMQLQTGDAKQTFKKQEYKKFLDCDIEKDAAKGTARKIVERTLVVYKPELSDEAESWSFMLNNRVVNVDISETNIAAAAFKRGEIRVGDTYKVKMEELEYQTPTGLDKTKYKVLEVLEFKRGNRQGNLI